MVPSLQGLNIKTDRWGIEMNSKKAFQIKLVIFGLILMIFLLGFQGIKGETTSVSGVIGSIDKDYQFIYVGGTKYLISSATTIVDEKGNKLKINDLTPGLSVTIESLRYSDSFSAKKIVIRKAK
jgi:hypothetical protein